MTTKTPNMTQEEIDQLQSLLVRVEVEFDKAPEITGFLFKDWDLSKVKEAEDDVRSFVDGLLAERDAEIERLKAKLEKICAARDEAQSVLSVLNADPTVAMFQIAAHFQTMGNKVGRILQDEAEKILQKRELAEAANDNDDGQKGTPKRDNWAHHVDFYHDGAVGIVRHDGTLRTYQPTEASKQRLKNTIDSLQWSWRPPTMLDTHLSRIKNRAIAPMRRLQ